MKKNSNFTQQSYQNHENHFEIYGRGGDKEAHAKTWLLDDTVDAWRHRRVYQLLDPLIDNYSDAKWLTVGDGRYGNDAHYIKQKGRDVLATDISDTLLKEALEAGHIDNYKKENAEFLSFSDNEFDFVFCKGSYHHFPRPMIALHEMLRVSRQAVILIEPCDPYIMSSILDAVFIGLKNILRYILNKKKNKHNFEPSGNYIYGISRRELEKVALGINLNMLAYAEINDCYIEGLEYEKYSIDSDLYKKMNRKIRFLDIFSRLKLKQPTLLAAIVFKENPDSNLRKKLESKGFSIAKLPDNPYI